MTTTVWKRLRWIAGINPPIFVLGVGAQKAGTSWLYEYLNSCENTKMGRLKEYHVWDGLLQTDKFPEFDFINPQSGTASFLDMQRKFQADPRTYFRYFRGLVNDAEITGDITPSYCGLSPQDFKIVRRKLRRSGFRVKVVFLMRDPVERCWSASRMYARNEEMCGGPEWPYERLVDHFVDAYRSESYQIRTRYERTLDALDRSFHQREVYTGFYEDMFELPQIRRLAMFLGVRVRSDERERIRNPSVSADLPAEIRRKCHEFYRSTYEYCWNRFPQTRSLWPSL